MKIAVLADIHANYIALKQVLADAKKFKAERILVLGDLVGYYYWPDKVLKLLEVFESTAYILGNHERMLKSIIDGKSSIDQIVLKYGNGIRKAVDKLTDEQKYDLTNYPSEKKLKLCGCNIFMCHGSPFNEDQYVYPDSPRSLLERCVLPDFDFVFMGHTHYPFSYQSNNTMVVNPGSVGQPRDIGNLASYVILDTNNKTVVFRRVLFDIEPIINACNKIDPGYKYLKEVLMRNSVVYKGADNV